MNLRASDNLHCFELLKVLCDATAMILLSKPRVLLFVALVASSLLLTMQWWPRSETGAHLTSSSHVIKVRLKSGDTDSTAVPTGAATGASPWSLTSPDEALARHSDVTTSPPTSSPNFPPLLWEGGGVHGATAAQTRLEIRSMIEQHHDITYKAACGAMMTDPHGSSPEAPLHHAALQDMHSVMLSFVTYFTAQGLVRDDCWIHLTPQQRAMCAVLAAVDDHDETEAGVRSPLDERRAYMSSYCSTMVPCLQWRAGRFSYPINGTYLLKVYGAEVVPLVTEHEENRQAVDALTHIFAHDEDNVDAEAIWILNRTLLHEEVLGRHQALFEAFQREAEHEKKKLPLVLSAADRANLVWAREPLEGLSTSVLLGHHGAFDAAQREVRISSRETGEEVALHHFTPLQVVALLYRKVAGSFDLRQQYARPTAEDSDDRLMDESVFRSNMHLIVFSGDSMNREFFLRLVFHIRFGNEPPPHNPYLRQTPFHEPSQQHDMVYSVFEDHDELDMFHSMTSNGKSGRTVSAFFQKLKWDVRRYEKFPETTVKPNVALLYVIYYWDPQTDAYRRELLPELPLLQRTMGDWAEHAINATENLEDIANGRGYLRIDAEHQKEKTLRGNDDIAMIAPGQPCHVRLRIPNGGEKLIDVASHQSLISTGGDSRRSQVAPPFMQLGKGGRGRMLQTSSSLMRGSGFTQRSGCSPERAAAAIRVRDTYIQRHKQRFHTKTPTPLRDIGIRVPVVVQGNVFWDYARNVQMTQHQFMMLLATDDDVPTLPHLPRRATPKDQTEFYMFSASFHENLQPYLRSLSPLYRKHHIDPDELQGGNATAARRHQARRLLEHNSGGGADIANDEDNGDVLDELASTGADVLIRNNDTWLASSTLSEVRESADDSLDRKGLPSSLFHHLTTTYPGKSIESLLRQHRVTPETHHNLIKNVQQLLWFQAARNARRRIVAAAHKRAEEKRLLNARRSPFRYVESMTLLEMGKLQAMGFAQGDARHFSCRYTQVKDKIRFRASFEAFGIRNVLSMGSHRANTQPQFCRLHRRGAGGAGGTHTTLNASSAANATSSSPTKQLPSLENVVEMFVSLMGPSHVREALWQQTGMGPVEHQISMEDPMVTVERIMHFQDYKEYGVIVHDDEDRCVDDGNLFLLEVLLSKMVLRDVQKRAVL